MREQKQKLPSNLYFGLFFSAIFVTLGVINLGSNSFLSFFIPIITGICFLYLGLFLPDTLRPLNYLWMSLGLALAQIFNPIIMATIFFGLFAPISLISRLFGRDELRIKNHKNSTYWVTRNKTPDLITDFKRQF